MSNQIGMCLLCAISLPMLIIDIPQNFEFVYYHNNKTCDFSLHFFCGYFNCYMNDQRKFKFVQFDFDSR